MPSSDHDNKKGSGGGGSWTSLFAGPSLQRGVPFFTSCLLLCFVLRELFVSKEVLTSRTTGMSTSDRDRSLVTTTPYYQDEEWGASSPLPPLESQPLPPSPPSPPPPPPRKIYIDLGSNNGQTLLYVLNGNKHIIAAGSGSSSVDGGQKVHIPQGDVEGPWTVIGVEPNGVRFSQNLEDVKKLLLESGQVSECYIYADTAVTTYDGTVTFLLEGDHGGESSSINTDTVSNTLGNTREVAAVDIVTLFNKHNIREEDYVVVKMDIEGAEFDVVKHLLLEGLHKKVDVMAVEWHHTNPYVLGPKHDKYDKVYDTLSNFLTYTNITMLDWGR